MTFTDFEFEGFELITFMMQIQIRIYISTCDRQSSKGVTLVKCGSNSHNRSQLSLLVTIVIICHLSHLVKNVTFDKYCHIVNDHLFN